MSFKDETLLAGKALFFLSNRLIRRHRQLDDDRGQITNEEYAERSHRILMQKSMVDTLQKEWIRDARENEFERFCVELCSSRENK